MLHATRRQLGRAGLWPILLLLSLTIFQEALAQVAPTYDIVYVRAPRYGDITFTKWPEVINPVQMEPGADLVLLHPNATEEVLFLAGNGAVVDPVPSFDAKWVYFSYFPDVRTAQLNYQRNFAPMRGADIYKINVATRQVIRLTQQKWEPLMSSFKVGAAFHFQTQLSDSRIAVVEYYNLNNNGFGTLLAFNAHKTAGAAPFGSPLDTDASNPLVRRGVWFFDSAHPAHLQPRYSQYRFSPPGLTALSAFTHGEDQASGYELDGSWAGKVTHPSAAPNNDALVVWSPGPVNNLNRPTELPRADGGIYLLKSGAAINDHRQLVLVKNDPRFNEMQPKALVPYVAIHGVAAPATLPYLPNDGAVHATLPAGTPFGLVGSSSFYKRDSAPKVADSPRYRPRNLSLATGDRDRRHVRRVRVVEYPRESLNQCADVR